MFSHNSRDKLRSFEGKEGFYTAVFQRTGFRPKKPKSRVQTAVLENIRNDKNEFITDHLWVDMCPEFKNAYLKKGDYIEFWGTVKSYMTDHSDRDVDPEKSFTFCDIHDVVKITSLCIPRYMSYSMSLDPTAGLPTIAANVSNGSSIEHKNFQINYNKFNGNVVFSENFNSKGKKQIGVKLDDLISILNCIKEERN